MHPVQELPLADISFDAADSSQCRPFRQQASVGRSQARFWKIALAFSLYLAQSALLLDWQVDDAGITFAYARNLAAGHGLVSQPGFAPVEGYSNPAWMLLCAVLIKLGLFNPAFSAKALAAVCVLGTMIIVERLLSRWFALPSWATLAALLILGLNASFVIWCNSGLENSLYALLAAASLYALCQLVQETGSGMCAALAFGAFSAGLALTRPDGMIYFGALPVAAWATRGFSRAAKLTCVATLPYMLLFGGYLACRVGIFHALLPNTALMKGGASFLPLAEVLLLRSSGLLKLLRAFSSLCAVETGWTLVALAVLAVFGRHVFRDSRAAVAVAVFAALALVAFLLLPPDWMPHQRFATPLIVALSVLVPVVLREILTRQIGFLRGKPSNRRTLIAWGLCAAFLLGAVNVLCVWSFSRAHIVAFDEIIRQSEELNDVAHALGVRDGSVLAADVGGMLWTSQLKVYDLLGLTDRTVAATFNNNRPALLEYLFGEVRPTFIKGHQKIFDLAGLDQDPRFARDYTLLLGQWKPGQPVEDCGHVIFVRRTAIAGKAPDVAQIQQQYGPAYAASR
jgi:hypothetical protein